MTSAVTGMTETAVRAQNAVFGAGDGLKVAALTALLEETRDNPGRAEGAPLVVPTGDWMKAMGIKY
jgi:hypothetical protein